jgi:hypothetical protein
MHGHMNVIFAQLSHNSIYHNSLYVYITRTHCFDIYRYEIIVHLMVIIQNKIEDAGYMY